MSFDLVLFLQVNTRLHGINEHQLSLPGSQSGFPDVHLGPFRRLSRNLGEGVLQELGQDAYSGSIELHPLLSAKLAKGKDVLASE